MEELTIHNKERQINKKFRKSKNENQELSIIKYPYLKQLNLIQSCIDYYEQFLIDTKMDLAHGVRVYMLYEQVKKVTRNFTRNRTRTNCAKINFANLCTQLEFARYGNNFPAEKQQIPEYVKHYFPHTKID
jgi:hypothetical protein